MPYDTPATRPVPAPPPGRAGDLVALLGLQPHPEGGWFREIHRSAQRVQPQDGRSLRCGLTSIDFLLAAGERSAWHRVDSDEAWHLLEGDGLRLWLAAPDLSTLRVLDLGPADGTGRRPRAVVPAGAWQAAEPVGAHALVGATVGPGFEFADFAFLRDQPGARDRLASLDARAVALL